MIHTKIFCYTLSIFDFRYIAICTPFLRIKYNIKTVAYILPILLFCPLYNLPRFFEFKHKSSNVTEYTKWNCTENEEVFTVDDKISMKGLIAINKSFDLEIQCLGLEKNSVHSLTPTETRKDELYFTVSINAHIFLIQYVF